MLEASAGKRMAVSPPNPQAMVPRQNPTLKNPTTTDPCSGARCVQSRVAARELRGPYLAELGAAVAARESMRAADRATMSPRRAPALVLLPSSDHRPRTAHPPPPPCSHRTTAHPSSVVGSPLLLLMLLLLLLLHACVRPAFLLVNFNFFHPAGRPPLAGFGRLRPPTRRLRPPSAAGRPKSAPFRVAAV